MFGIFRIFLIFFSVVSAVLSIWAFVGSYKNESYLTGTYLIDVHLTSLNLSSIFDENNFKKRDLTFLEERTDSLSDLIPSGTSSISAAVTSDIQSILENIEISLNYSDLGLSDVYSISYWGYCKGEVTADTILDSSIAKYVKPFDNNKINFTYCSNPVLGYKFDPVTIIQSALNDTINSLTSNDNVLKEELEVLVDNLTSNNLILPGNLNQKLNLIHTLTIVSLAFILATGIFSVISVLIQLLGCCLTPENCCLSFLNFLFQVLIFVCALIGAAVVTGSYIEVRSQINENISKFGMKAFLSINFYAFVWAAFVATLLLLFLSILGNCLGMFRQRRAFQRSQYEQEPLMAYQGKY